MSRGLVRHALGLFSIAAGVSLSPVGSRQSNPVAVGPVGGVFQARAVSRVRASVTVLRQAQDERDQRKVASQNTSPKPLVVTFIR